jgi:hypothetical protein
MQLVTIAIFAAAFTANVVQGRLQADGIECYIQDEHTVQVNPLYNNALGGIKLQVKDTYVPVAVSLLRQSGYPTVFDRVRDAGKAPHVIIQFLKFIAAAALLLGWLYLTDFKGKM